MDKKLFEEYDEAKGIGDLLFVNKHHSNKYRFYRRKNSWDDCFMVEFCSNSDNYHYYWGHNESERKDIDLSFELLPVDSPEEWSRTSFNPLLAYNLPEIVKKIEKSIWDEQKHIQTNIF